MEYKYKNVRGVHLKTHGRCGYCGKFIALLIGYEGLWRHKGPCKAICKGSSIIPFDAAVCDGSTCACKKEEASP